MRLLRAGRELVPATEPRGSATPSVPLLFFTRRRGSGSVLSTVMTRFVVLRHELPDGSWHFDWLLDPGGPREHPDERRLVSFRTLERPDLCGGAGFEARQMPDHRLLYLDFEGELSGSGRGRVARIVHGLCELHRAGPEGLEVTLHPDGGSPVSLKGVRSPATPGEALPRWKFRLLESQGQQPGSVQDRLGHSEAVRR